MLKNYFKTAFRNIFKHKTYSAINITGLAIGITAFFLIINYVSFEFSYDSFNKNYNNIYRVNTIQYSEDNSKSLMAVSASAVGPAMKNEFREVTDYTRLFKIIRTVVSYREKAFRDFDIFYADSSFLKIFTYPLLSGDAGTALKNPNSVLITEEVAKKYFGKANPIGKILKFSNRYDILNCAVTGILKNIPENSHIKFDILVSINTPSKRLTGFNVKDINTNWNYDLYYNYVLLKPGTNYKMLNRKLQSFYGKHKPGSKNVIVLKPLKDIYLSQPAMFDFITGNKKIIYLLLTFALMIIIIAWINYVNLSTAKSMERAKEVGIRKAVGSNRTELIRQFLLESVLVNIISVIVSIIFIELSKPYFCNIVGKKFTYSTFSFEQWLILIALFIAGILASGWYPAVVLSSFKPSAVLKGNGIITKSGNGNIIRKALIVFQFTSSIILIIVTFMVYKQIVFMQNKSLGMNIDHLLVIKSPVPLNVDKYTKDMSAFKNEVVKIPAVKSAAGSYYIPGSDIRWRPDFKKVNSQSENAINCGLNSIDEDFIKTYQFKILAGRSFSKKFGTDRQGIILNETASKLLGLSNPADAIGKVIKDKYGNEFHVVGIIRNYNQTSLRNDYRPVAFVNFEKVLNYYTLRLKTDDLKNTISKIHKTWAEVFPDRPFVYFFMNDYFNKQYHAELQFRNMAAMFAFLSIIVACLGLFGLSSFTLLKKTKEIGIRKVLGAGIPNILYLLTKEYIYLLISAIFFAYPVAYVICRMWLSNYAFRTELSLSIFVLPALLIMIIALATVSIQTIKAATENTIKALRHE